MRLQKYLAECGVASRRTAERLIAHGRVAVNGEVATIGRSIQPDVDRVTLDAKPVAQDQKVYLVLNKPANTVTTAKDTHGRKTVLDLVKDVKARVFPVGRLDKDVEGVLLLMNDGELAHQLIHPSFQVKKVYHARVHGIVGPEAVRQLQQGVLLEDGKSAPAKCVVLEHKRHTTHLALTLHEGRKHEVKRMCAAVGHPVRGLRRIAFAGINADNLRSGEWRYLSSDEIDHLRKLTAP